MPRPGIIQNQFSSPDLNQGPSDLQSDALPTELSRHVTGNYSSKSKEIYTDAHYSISTFNKFYYNEISSIIDDNLPVIISIWRKNPFLFAYRPIALMLSIKVVGFIDKSYRVTRNRRMFWGIKL